MSSRLDPVAEIATEAARVALPEHVVVGDATMLPRGADPFIGSARPMLLAATRWAVVSPGGVLIGGDPAGLAAMFGFDVPEKTPAPPADRKPGDPRPPTWGHRVAEESRASLTTFSHAVANAVIALAGLPADCAATQISLAETDADVRAEVGPISDAVVLVLHSGGFEARIVVVVPGIFIARMSDAAVDAEVVQTKGETLARPVASDPELLQQITAGPLDAALARVPLDLALELGRARVPLARVLHLGEGEVLELRQKIDAPIDLVCESFTVARGDLEVDHVGHLVLVVTSVPGAPRATPHVFADAPRISSAEIPGPGASAEPTALPGPEGEADAARAGDPAAAGDPAPPETPAIDPLTAPAAEASGDDPLGAPAPDTPDTDPAAGGTAETPDADPGTPG